MDNIVKQLKQFKTDAIYEKKNTTMLLKENVDIIKYYPLHKYF